MPHVDMGDRDKDSLIRKGIVKIAHKMLGNKCYLLNTPTVEIDEKQDLLAFLLDNPMFRVDPKGFDFVYGRGTRAYNKKQETSVGWVYQEIGELATIYLACKEFLSTKCEYFLYVQDDTVLEHNFYDLLISYLNEVPKDFDAFFQYVPAAEYLIPKFATDTENITYSYQSGSTGCFVLSRKGAEQAVKHFESEPGVNLCISWFFLKTGLFNCYSLRPHRAQGCRAAEISPLIPEHVLTIRSPLTYLTEEYAKLDSINKGV
jgi:hypothetical protein